ncbi:MAG TPA: riboflavin synthase [Solirubrobacteraceae bacterium]
MFTGLVQDLGRIVSADRNGDGARMTVETALASELCEGDSVSVNGVCLTATEVGEHSFAADVMNETLSRTSLASVRPGLGVNLELPLRPSDRLGGHVVQGHVDGLATIAEVGDDGFARRVRFDTDPELLRYVVEKGSIALDGVSLTVIDIGDAWFTVSLIPESLERTNLGAAEPGTKVNVEVDVLAKYVERLIGERGVGR